MRWNKRWGNAMAGVYMGAGAAIGGVEGVEGKTNIDNPSLPYSEL